MTTQSHTGRLEHHRRVKVMLRVKPWVQSISTVFIGMAYLPAYADASDAVGRSPDPRQQSSSAAQPTPAEQNSDESQSDTLETVIVTGIVGSLTRTIDAKRSDTAIVDAVSAEDVGKFPDNNVAESLQRITGVEITRDGNGEGQYVSVRGLPTEFSLVTLNGLSGSSITSQPPNFGFNSRSRSFDFSLISSNFISSLRVYKSARADLDEGAIAANVDVQTVTPFQIGKQRMLLSAKLQNTPGMDGGRTYPDITGLYSNVFGDRAFGLTLGFDWNKRYAPNQQFANVTWGAFCLNPANPSNPDGTCAGGATHMNYQQTILQNSPTKIDTKTGYFSAQWKPTDSTTATLNGLHARREMDQRAAIFIEVPAYPWGSNTFSGPLDPQYVNVDAGNMLTTLANSRNWAVDRSMINNTDDVSKNLSLNVKTTLGDWELSETALYSGSRTFNYNFHTQLGATTLLSPTGRDVFGGYQIFSGADVPGFIYDPTFNYSDPSQWGSDEATYAGIRAADRARSLQMDVTRYFNDSPVQSVKFGAKILDHKAPITIWNWYYNAVGANTPFTTAITQEEAAQNILSGYNGPGTRLRNLLFADPTLWLNQYFGGNIDNLINSPRTNRQGIPYADVSERGKSLYAMADFKIDSAVPIHGNVGVRYQHTSTTSGSLGFDLDRVVFDPNCQRGDPTCQQLSPSADSLVSKTSSYQNLLPSLNLIADLRDNMLLRFSFSKTMTRPTLSQLPPNVNIDGPTRAITQGNPGLQPFKSTNYDLSYEWYFRPSSVFSVALYNKEMTGFIQTIQRNYSMKTVGGGELPFTLTAPVNGSGGYVRGAEADYKQFFDFLPSIWSGFGTEFNITYSKGQLDEFNLPASGSIPALNIPATPFVGLTKITYNAVLFYEQYGFSWLVAFNHRDRYLAATGFTPGGLPVNSNVPLYLYTKARNQIDMQASYMFNDHFKVFVEATNLQNKPFVQYSQIQGTAAEYPTSWTLNGRRLSVGATLTF